MVNESKMTRENVTTTANGAIAYSTTFSTLVDQFGLSGNYMHRAYDDVCKDMEKLWDNEDRNSALRFVFYLRLITRNTAFRASESDKMVKTEKVQKGLGLKDEFIKRLLWIAAHDEATFIKNLWIVPFIGSWKDLFVLMHYDIELDVNCLNRNIVYGLISACLRNNIQVDLIKKFMPRIDSMKKNVTSWTKNKTRFGKELAKYMGIPRLTYNKLKSSGTAHDFQKHLCKKEYDMVEWSRIPGKALSLIVNSRLSENKDVQASLIEWLDKQDTVPYNGYVFELMKNVRNRRSPYSVELANKQFETLVNKAIKDGKITENVLPILDTSGSMGVRIGNSTAMDISMSLGIFFSTINKGYFHDCVMMFDERSYFLKFNGKTFAEKVNEVPMNAMGSTNFQSVIDAIVKLRKENPQIPLEEYPTTLLVVSDMQFNPTVYNWTERKYKTSNNEMMKMKLYEVFPKEFVNSMKFVWWNCVSSEKNFPTECKEGGEYLLSGFDGSIITLLLENETQQKEEKPTLDIDDMINKVLSQEILQLVSKA